MEFQDLKNEIINRAKKASICSELYKIQIAESEQDIIDAAIDLADWAFRIGIIDKDLLLNFDQDNLSKNQIFITGNYDISKPTINSIYVFGDAVINLNISEGVYNLFCFDSSAVTLNINGIGYVEVKTFGGTLNVNMQDNSLVNASLTKSKNEVIVNDNAIFHAIGYNDSNLNLTLNKNAYSKYTGFFNSNINVTTDEKNNIEIILNQASTQDDKAE